MKGLSKTWINQLIITYQSINITYFNIPAWHHLRLIAHSYCQQQRINRPLNTLEERPHFKKFNFFYLGKSRLLWTDVVLALLIFVGLFIIFLLGVIETGGYRDLIDRARHINILTNGNGGPYKSTLIAAPRRELGCGSRHAAVHKLAAVHKQLHSSSFTVASYDVLMRWNEVAHVLRLVHCGSRNARSTAATACWGG